MAGTVLRTPAAVADLKQIADFIGVENQSPAAARKFLADFEQKCLAYSNQPEMGELRPELGDELRSFPFRKYYVVVYQPDEDGIEILRVFHGARDYFRFFDV